jgi:uncharacterized protein YcnI
MKRPVAFALAVVGSLVVTAAASAHAHVSPSIVPASESQMFTLAVATEKEDASTTGVELTPPDGFSIDSFIPSPGWKRDVQKTGSGEDAVITKITWTGGDVPTDEDAAFSFLGSTDSSKTYTFGVRQTYSDGSVVDWTGPETSDTPAPTIEAKSASSFGGGGGSSTLAIVALIVGAIGVVLGIVALVTSSGKRSLA